MKDFLSRFAASYGEQVSTKIPVTGGSDIKGQNNRRQIVFGASLGLAAGKADNLISNDQEAYLNSIGYRTGSRAEQLWGEGFVVSLNDVASVS